jgi:nucleoid-associated protein YgaU
MKKFKLLSLKNLVPQSKVTKPRKPVTRLAARLTQPAYDDYEEEPTTKLSTAFVVVLVLHLVAVGGVYAFHSIKAKRREADGTAITASVNPQKEGAAKTETVAKTPAVTPSPAPAALAPSSAPSGVAPAPRAAVVQHVEKVPAGPSAVVPQPAKPVPVPAAPAQAGAGATAKVSGTGAAHGSTGDGAQKTYTVQKGDNPVAIAKRMGVNYDELLKINGVDDPKRLKIGQVLKLPVRTKPTAN